jgi:UTP--glucose-1-phosphate uridylyltransferase
MSVRKVRKAVIPAAGFGTRFLPFTKSVPKELIPLVDKPVIQYVVEEAAASGIEEILIILSSGKEAIRHHFSPAPELEQRLEETGKTKILDELRSIGGGVRISYTCQHELNGLGGAVLLAKEFVGNEFFAILLGDTVMSSTTERPVTGQLVDAYMKYGAAVVAAEIVPPELVSRYGIIGGKTLEDGAVDVTEMIEKPSVAEAPSRLAVASRYLLSPAIFEALEHTPRGKGNEVQLTDAMRSLLGRERLIGRPIAGKRHDIGDKLSFLENTVEFALRRPEFRDKFMTYLKSVTAQETQKEE